MRYTLVKNTMAQPRHRAEYNRLAVETFGLSFEDWYNSGHFDGSHIPYTLFDGDKAVANISVNRMELLFDGRVRKYIQLGTVMTHKDYRRQGLQKFIFNEIINDMADDCDAVFLFANRSVLEFYPKLGFEKTTEYSFIKNITATKCQYRRLDMDNAADVEVFRSYYKKGNSFSALEIKNGFALEMFYCSGPYKNNVFCLPEYDAVVVCETDENSVSCLDIFGGENYSIEQIMSAFGKEKLIMGFTPKDTAGFETEQLQDDDTTLFVYKNGENIFTERELLFPLICHT